LDALGVAESGGASASADKAGLLIGLQDLRKCFKIRCDELGPWHVDTVETMNKISNIYMKLKWFPRAKHGFFEVLTMRTAIFGEQHPSVAVAAQSLGMAHLKMHEEEQAKAYLLQALNIFALCGLAKHAFAHRIRQNVEKLGFDQGRVEI
jgi:tetratricopeptide (TPR) repeat protein